MGAAADVLARHSADGARVIDATTESFVFEITGGSEKIEEKVLVLFAEEVTGREMAMLQPERKNKSLPYHAKPSGPLTMACNRLAKLHLRFAPS